MQQDEISNDELTLAMSYLSGVFPIRYETTASIASALANLVVFGLPEDYYDVYRARIAGVTSASVLKAAKAHVRADSLQIAVVGNPEIIRSPVEALGFGPVTVHQPEES
jgi:zinc protease